MNPAEQECVVQVALALPLRKVFDYISKVEITSGCRVLVPFGTRRIVGVVISSLPARTGHKLKSVIQVLDTTPIFSDQLFSLLKWAAKYYHHPIGEVISSATPIVLRGTVTLNTPLGDNYYRARTIEEGTIEQVLQSAPVQLKIYQSLSTKHWKNLSSFKNEHKGWRSAIDALIKKSLVEHQCSVADLSFEQASTEVMLNQEQQIAADQIANHLGGFRSILLQGITGSGKTEVYLDAAKKTIAAGRQVLFLVPEISLTPQLMYRVQQQLGKHVYGFHSGMSDKARYRTWWLARQGIANAVLGTRSAVFTPMKNPGLIIVDEEHDLSYKQQDGFRYHGRDLAIKRASLENTAIVLGSATPSIESLQNAENGRHLLLALTKRIGTAVLPTISTIDISLHQPENGLAKPIIDAIRQRLDRNEQSIIYINRRGYAPYIKCYQCEWQASCLRCDMPMTYHKNKNQFRCHHCGSTQKGQSQCPSCEASLFFAGFGTQRIEQAILGRFPEARLCRLDRDEANTSNKLYRQLAAIQQGEVDIIIGTQLITKGHDFPQVTLVCVVNADQGLYSVDFRAPEMMFQQLLQVSGRAGRSEAPGAVLIQTQQPNHPTIQQLCRHDYQSFAQNTLIQRREVGYPPYGYFALFRAESPTQASALGFLNSICTQAKLLIDQHQVNALFVRDAVSSPMEKLADRYRCQLLVQSSDRSPLHWLLDLLLEYINQSKIGQKIRWSIDIDPMDMT